MIPAEDIKPTKIKLKRFIQNSEVLDDRRLQFVVDQIITRSKMDSLYDREFYKHSSFNLKNQATRQERALEQFEKQQEQWQKNYRRDFLLKNNMITPQQAMFPEGFASSNSQFDQSEGFVQKD